MPSEKCLLYFTRWMIHRGVVVSRQCTRYCAERRFRWSILDILCEPVMILSASFCVGCIFSELVSLAFVLQTCAAKLAINLPNALYVNSLCMPMLSRHYFFY